LPLSVIVVAYDMARELPRTLQSLSVGYQRDVQPSEYEVIVVDNGSPTPIDESVFAGLSGQFRLIRLDDAAPSPARAVNVGLQVARGETVGVLLDGARLVSPGLVHFALTGSRMYPRSAVVALGWYLGYDYQRYALEAGWTQADEDKLLKAIDWPSDGYRLFEIATMDECSVGGWFEPIFESNALFLPAAVWEELGGYDERFDSAGGGLINYDTLRRASGVDGLRWVILLGEATFHQLHGGIATNAPWSDIQEAMGGWTAQYQSLRGLDPVPLALPNPSFVGTVPPGLRSRYAHALNTKLHGEGFHLAPIPPPVALPEPEEAPQGLPAQWVAAATDAATRGLDIEATAFARFARVAGADTSEVGPLLGCVAAEGSISDLPSARLAQFHVTSALAYHRAGLLDRAAAEYDEALAIEPGKEEAYLGLSMTKMPGPFYWEVLRRLHEHLEPDTYLEIGVADGASLTLARPPTVAVAVDPVLAVRHPISVECHFFPETSGEFFSSHDARRLFGGKGPDLVFIDGLHEYGAVLEDFAHVEAIADPDTIVVLHDMIPFDELTQRPERVHAFHTGDVWKLLHCFADVRPDLSWFTVRTPPSGLTFVTRLDPTSTVLADRRADLVERYRRLDYDETRSTPGPVLENEWDLVAERLDQWKKPRRAPSSTAGNGEASSDLVTVELASRAALARRIRRLDHELQTAKVNRRVAYPELEPSAARAEVQVRLAQLHHARAALEMKNAELEAVRRTRLFRWSSPLRKVYGSLRRQSNRA